MGNRERIVDNNLKISSNNLSINDIIERIKRITAPLDTSDATAVASDILKSKTAYVKGVKITGTMEEPIKFVDDNEGNVVIGGIKVTAEDDVNLILE